MQFRSWLALCLCLVAPVARATDYAERAKAYGASTAAGDALGIAVATDGRWTVAGARQDAATGPGKAHVYQGCSAITEFQELTASDGANGDEFGMSVAVDHDVMVIGARQLTTGSGAAYVFRFDGTQWIEEQKLVPFDGLVGDLYGHAVDVQGDLIAVGAYKHFGGTGALYLYRFDGAQWNFEFKYVPVGAVNARLGVDVSVDGDRVAAGAYNYSAGQALQGSVWVFRYDGTGWRGEGTLTPSDAAALDQSGASVALHGDRMVVGTPGYQANRGSAVVFEWDGATWQESERLIAADSVAGDGIGWQVDLDGDTAVMSAYLHDSAAPDAGAIYVFCDSGTQWVETQKLTASDAEASDRLYAVALAGGQLVAGALLEDDRGTDAGAIYVFTDPLHRYGAGVAGAGALVPDLDASGSITPGGAVTLHLRDFVGGTRCALFVGLGEASIPFAGGQLLLDPTQMIWGAGFLAPGAAGVPGDGDVDQVHNIPNSPGLSCQTFFLQGIGVDPAAPGGLSLTNGLRVLID